MWSASMISRKVVALCINLSSSSSSICLARLQYLFNILPRWQNSQNGFFLSWSVRCSKDVASRLSLSSLVSWPSASSSAGSSSEPRRAAAARGSTESKMKDHFLVFLWVHVLDGLVAHLKLGKPA